jgi:alkyl sulfatase BDS1-like metallo-beta-lactamase superfamily hydrolase|tara:strand:- start:2348 stop:4063 length:1716 start_codon:yes stop_codon:yes gene_type:complete
MKFNYIYLAVFLFIVSSCSSENEVSQEFPKTSKVEKLIEHSKEFERNIYSYDTPGGKIHIAVGFGIANSIMVEGVDGNIIIDSADSTFEASQIYALFKLKNNNPIKAVIYTHNHGDHTFGTSFYLTTQAQRPKIIAHESTDFYMQRILGIIEPIISKRSTRMFGTALAEGEVINVGIGSSLNISKSPIGYIQPDVTFNKELKINIAGVNIELYHAPGETNDQLFVWLPDHLSLMPGDNIYRTFPNLYTIRGTTHRDVAGWVNSLDHMRSFNPQYLFPSHTKPLTGNIVMETLTIYRDAIQYVHDQTIRLINEGLTPDEIVKEIELPAKLAESPFLSEFYGTIRWSVKSIFNGYLGWFSGNPTDLDPLSTLETAQRLSELLGGEDKIFIALEAAIFNKDMQWALELSDQLIALEYSLEEVYQLKKEALLYIGNRSSNPNKRNYFLTSALELDKNFKGFPETIITEGAVSEISIDTMFSRLSVSLNPENIYKDNYNVCFIFPSGNNKTISIRNDVAAISNSALGDCNITVEASETVIKQVLSGLISPVKAIASGAIQVDGGSTNFLQFLASFR